jgi:hypothetical protein
MKYLPFLFAIALISQSFGDEAAPSPAIGISIPSIFSNEASSIDRGKIRIFCLDGFIDLPAEDARLIPLIHNFLIDNAPQSSYTFAFPDVKLAQLKDLVKWSKNRLSIHASLLTNDEYSALIQAAIKLDMTPIIQRMLVFSIDLSQPSHIALSSRIDDLRAKLIRSPALQKELSLSFSSLTEENLPHIHKFIDSLEYIGSLSFQGLYMEDFVLKKITAMLTKQKALTKLTILGDWDLEKGASSFKDLSAIFRKLKEFTISGIFENPYELWDQLKLSTNLEVLVVKGKLQYEGALALGGALEKMQDLQYLTITGEFKVDGATAISGVLAGLKKLTSLSMSTINIPPNSAESKQVSEALASKLPRANSIVLNGNQIK